MLSILSIDGAVLVVYVVGLLYIGMRSPRTAPDHHESYLLGGRRLTLVPLVATLVSTWYGGILGIGEFTFRYGVVNWVVFGLPYYFFALLYALYLAPAIRESDDLSIPERLRRHYGRRASKWGSLLIFIQSTPAPYLLMLAIMANMVFGVSLTVGLLVGAAVSTIYLWRGGFESVVRTDLLQAALMLFGFATILLFLVREQSPLEMWRALPLSHRTIVGENGVSIQTIIVWFLIASWTFVDPGFYQRCAAAKDGPTAQRGIFISVAIWFIFDLMTTATGLYAVVQLPQLTHAAASFPELAVSVLPSGVRGFFLVALLAVIMSTIDSLSFIGGITLGRDMVPEADSPAVQQRRIQWGMIASVVLGVLLAMALPSVIELWFTLGMILVPGLIVPLLITFHPFWKLSDVQAVAVGTAGVGLSATWLLLSKIRFTDSDGAPANPLGLEPMIPGLALSIAVAWYFIWRGNAQT